MIPTRNATASDGRPDEAALLAETALSDWNRPEEDAAWAHLLTAEPPRLPHVDHPPAGG